MINSFSRYLNIRSAYGASFDPLGDRVAFLSDITGVPQLWLIDQQGGWPHQLTFFEDRVSVAEWQPTGERILFAMDTDGDERHQLYLLDPRSPRETVSLDHDPAVMHVFGAWSPDGSRIAYASNRRDPSYFDVYVHEVPDGESRIVYQEDASNSAVAWVPDGGTLVISRAKTNVYQDLLLLDLESLEATQIGPAGDLSRYESIKWQPDGRGFYCVTNRDRENMSLAWIDSSGGELTYVTDGPWEVETASLSHDGGHLAYAINEGGYSKVLIRDLRSRTDTPVTGLPEATLLNPRGSPAIRWSRDDSTLAVTVNGPRDNADVWLYSVQSGAARRLTHSATGGIPRDSFVEPKTVAYPTFDGRDIPAFLYSPQDASPDGNNPVIVHVHGGPESQERPQFTPNYQYFVSRGYCVFAPNVRGSTGYGRTYVHLDDVRKRMDSVRDLEHAWKWLVDSGWADSKRIAVMGGSYGGFMVLSAITTYPDLWAAAVELYGIADFLTFLENTSSYRRRQRAQVYGDPEKDADFLREISPIHYMDKVTAPLLVVHGATDPRVPISETEQLVEGIRGRGGSVEYIRFEDEGHGLVKQGNKLKAYPAIAEFLDRHIGPV